MNLVRIVYLSASLLVGIVLAGLLRSHPTLVTQSVRRQLAFSLAGLILALLCVGIVSHTFVRHVVQSAPVMVALLLVMRGSSHGTVAAAPIFTLWFGIVLNIWLFLFGIARIFTGTFTPIEIALTIIIAVVCAFGVTTIIRAGSSLAVGGRIAIAMLFAVLQFAGLVLSFQPAFS